MAKTLIVIPIGGSQADATKSTPVGTETLDASVAAGEIGIYLNTVGDRSSINDAAITCAMNALREAGYV